MAKKKAQDGDGRQWKVLSAHVTSLQSLLEEQSANGWTVFAILGDLGNLAVVVTRMITL